MKRLTTIALSMAIILQLISGVVYSATEEIKVKAINQGWSKENNKWYYYNANSIRQTGWINLSGTWYYLRSNGEMVIGWQKVGEKWYYLSESGAMKIGWLNNNGKWYYLRSNGEMATGWEKIGEKWYYLSESGAMKIGWLNNNGKWYYLRSNGEMATGWEKIGEKWYYLSGSGAMKTGWLNDNGIWYYLRNNGDMAINTTVDGWYIDNSGIATLFTYSAIPQSIKHKMLGNSLPQGVEIGFNDLSYLQLTYYGFDNKTHTGEMVVSTKVAKEVVDIFKELYEKRYPIEKIKLIDKYYANDNLSMEDNNSSAFCYRKIAGSNKLSNHAKGLAIDINPIQNPHVKGKIVSPVEGREYTNRNKVRKGMIIKGDVCYEAFTKRGWTWGGNWNNPDYQHFEKTVK